MKIKIILVSVLLITLIACTQKPFPKPENLAQKITNFVVAIDKSPRSTTYIYGSQWESKGLVYNHRIYKNHRIYDIDVTFLENGKRQLYIVYTLTNVNFNDLKTPADVAANILSGQPKMYRQVHIHDWEMDMKVDAYYTFQKPTGKKGALEGFTGDEFMLPFEESGIQEYILSNGEILQEEGWTEASPGAIKEAQEEYKEFLSEIAEYLKIK